MNSPTPPPHVVCYRCKENLRCRRDVDLAKPSSFACSGMCLSKYPTPKEEPKGLDMGNLGSSPLAQRYRASVAASVSVGAQATATTPRKVTLTCRGCLVSEIDVQANLPPAQLRAFLATSGWTAGGACRIECAGIIAQRDAAQTSPAVPLDLAPVNRAMESVNRGAALGRRRRGEAAWPADLELLASSDAARARAAKPATKTKPTPATGAR